MRFALRRTRDSIPAVVVRSLGLEPGESVRASAQDSEGRWYAGTERALIVPEGDHFRRVPWETIERAGWDRDSEHLVVVETAEFGRQQPTHRASLEAEGRLLELLRERVTASIVVTHFEPVEGKRGITVSARRSPHTDAELVWTVLVDKGLDADSPPVREAAKRGLAAARSEIGE
ncbi:MAG: hypothetical protein ACRDOJ_13995 [Nocardioidaceae bacterium]